MSEALTNRWLTPKRYVPYLLLTFMICSLLYRFSSPFISTSATSVLQSVPINTNTESETEAITGTNSKKEYVTNDEDINIEMTEINATSAEYQHELYEKYKDKVSNSKMPNTERLGICRTWPRGVGLFQESSITKGFKQSDIRRIHFMLLYAHARETGNYCSIESLIGIISNRTDLEFEIFLWINEESRDHISINMILKMFSIYPHIKVLLKDFVFEEAVSGTPFDTFFSCLDYFSVSLKNLEQQNKANAARVAILYKYGGYYADLDFIFFRDFLDLEQGFLEDRREAFNTAFLYFSKESSHSFLLKLIEGFVENYRNKWGNNGPALLQNVVQENCIDRVSHLDCSINEVETTFEVFGATKTTPIHWSSVKTFFEERQANSVTSSKLESALMTHLFHHMTKEKETKICKASVSSYSSTYIGYLRDKYCPTIMMRLKDTCFI